MMDPIAILRDTLEKRIKTEQYDATAMALATADTAGRPSVRMVLLKDIDHRGFVFFTNYQSRKARELDQNPFAALCMHWWSEPEQLRVEGRVERISDAESDAYFATRPRTSQLSAWASRQSEPLESRDVLIDRFHEMERRFEGQPVPRPPFWGGYRIVPERIEIWHGRENRLHDRVRYTRAGEGWHMELLQP